VKSWSGHGIKETETFAVSSREWRVKWTVTGDDYLGIAVHDDDGDLTSMAANTTKTGSDVSYVRGKGRFYLSINGSGKSDITVEEQQ
jgi:hypothetical protein